MTRVKICGVTLADDAARIAAAGVDYIGLNFWPKSKRFITTERAPTLAQVVRAMGPTKLVGLFVDQEVDEILDVVSRVELDVIQLHGDESPDQVRRIAQAVSRPVWKALPVASARDIEHLDVWPVEAVVLDAPTPGRGGSGTSFDWQLARQARERFPKLHVVLAGGLRPDNVAHAIDSVGPWAVDVASGVEAAPGVKDAGKLEAFLGAARA